MKLYTKLNFISLQLTALRSNLNYLPFCIPCNLVLLIGSINVTACKESGPIASKNSTSDWMVISKFDFGENEATADSGKVIKSASSITLGRTRGEFNNFMLDSRGTPMAYEDWKDVVLSANLSPEKTKLKLAMVGSPASIYSFTGSSSNHGFLVANESSAWAEIWDTQKIRRVRLDFDLVPDLNVEAAEICRELAELRWPANGQ
jgi:hypothetical protein